MTDADETYLTDEQVETFADDVRAALAQHGVTLAAPRVTLHREADIVFSNNDSTLDEIAPLIAASGATIAYLSANVFTTADAVPDDLDELAGEPVVIEFLESVTPLEGEIEAFTVMWAADGVLFSWFATAAWRVDMQRGLITALAQAIAGIEEDDEFAFDDEVDVNDEELPAAR